MITNDVEFLAAQAHVHVIQAMLAHARQTCTPESFHDQAKGWLTEWQRLEEDPCLVDFPCDSQLVAVAVGVSRDWCTG
jgi:hypothetical protein